MTHHAFIHGDVLDALRTLPDKSVHCIVTSPPYWGLRDYGVAGQLGLEDTPEEYVGKLVAVFREARRVLRDDGVLWLNLGDSYNSPGPNNHDKSHTIGTTKLKGQPGTRGWSELKPKDLIGIPWRVAFALQADGWWLRMDNIWEKPNPMPESVTDRPTKAHEYVFLMSKSERYFYDHEAIKETAAHPTRIRADRFGGNKHTKATTKHSDGSIYAGSATRNKRSVWTVSTKPFPGAHFATFPPDLIEPMILAGTSEKGCCPECGAPCERVIELGEPLREWQAACGADSLGGYSGQATKDYEQAKAQDASATKARILAGMRERKTVDWVSTCDCDAGEPVPCTVLDPFGGSGTVSLVAQRLGRHSVYIDINRDYMDMAVERCGFHEHRLLEVATHELIAV